MTPEREDPVLDSMLDEVLGGRTPPDLTERIMSAWAARRTATANQLAIERKSVRVWPYSAVALGTVALSILACVVVLNIGRRPDLVGRPEAGDGQELNPAVAHTSPEVARPKVEPVPPSRTLRKKPADDTPQIANSQLPSSSSETLPSVTPPASS
jgi:hypothetical protein